MELDRTVAIKLLSPQVAGDANALKRFEREARAAARLTHPGTVRIYAIGRTRTSPYLVMEYVEGTNLQAEIRQQGRLEPKRALQVTRMVAQGLAAAHEAGLVHRDVKPSNILLGPDNSVKVADFGLAKPVSGDASLTTTGMVVGTPYYMAPEQAQGLEVDHRSDMYSLGVTLYHMLAGSPPFTDGSPVSIAMQHVQAPLPDLSSRVPGLSEEVCRLVSQLTAKDPNDRPSTWAEALAAIQRAAFAALPQASTAQITIAADDLPEERPFRPAVVGALVVAGLLTTVAIWHTVTTPGQNAGAPRPLTATERFQPGLALSQSPRTTRPITQRRAEVPRQAPQATAEQSDQSLPPPAASTDYDFDYRQAYAMATPAELRQWTASGFMGNPRPKKRPSLRLGHLDIPPRADVEFWHRTSLRGCKRMKVQLKMDSLSRGNHVALMLMDNQTQERYMGLLGYSTGDRRPGGPGGPRVEGPNNKLIRVGGDNAVLAANDAEILPPGEIQELTLEYNGDMLRLLKNGRTVMESRVPGITDASFGLGFPEGGARVQSVLIEAETGG
jgi:hypothetical protein